MTGKGVNKNSAEAAKWYGKAAEQGDIRSQISIGGLYFYGDGVSEDLNEAAKWWQKAAEQGDAQAQFNLGFVYSMGVKRDLAEAAKWWQKAAEQDNAQAQFNVGLMYEKGMGVTKDLTKAAKWFVRAADQGIVDAQYKLVSHYLFGNGVDQSTVEAGKWVNLVMAHAKPSDFIQLNGVSFGARPLAIVNGTTLGVGEPWSPPIWTPLGGVNVRCLSVQSNGARLLIEGEKDEKFLKISDFAGTNSALFKEAEGLRAIVERNSTAAEIAESQRLARDFKLRRTPESGLTFSPEAFADFRPSASGTGFFISEDGFLVTNEHVVRDAVQVRLVTRAGLISARVLKVDAANDLALLKAEGRFASLAIAASRR